MTHVNGADWLCGSEAGVWTALSMVATSCDWNAFSSEGNRGSLVSYHCHVTGNIGSGRYKDAVLRASVREQQLANHPESLYPVMPLPLGSTLPSFPGKAKPQGIFG